MGDATTVYDVITRYIVETPGGGAIGRYDQSVNRLSDSMARNERLSVAMGRGLTRLSPGYLAIGAAAGVAVAGAAAMGASVVAANHELNNTLDLVGGISGRFQFATGAADNFHRSMAVSRKLLGDITSDTAGFGKRADSISSANRIKSDVFSAGGSVSDVRSLVASLAVIGRMVGGQQGASSQVSGMISGKASGSLFEMLQAQGVLPNDKMFKKLPSATRLRLVSDGLAKMADNPALRSAFSRTFENQAERFKSSLITLGTAFGDGPLDPLLDAFVSANDTLARNVDSMAASIHLIGDTMAGESAALKVYASAAVSGATNFVGKGNIENLKMAAGGIWDGIVSTVKNLMPSAIGGNAAGMLNVIGSATNPSAYKPIVQAPDFLTKARDARETAINDRREARELEKRLAERDSELDPLKLPKALVNQTINIKIDTKTDISPEALAVRITKVVGKELRMPTQGKRGPGPRLAPGAGLNRTS